MQVMLLLLSINAVTDLMSLFFFCNITGSAQRHLMNSKDAGIKDK